MSIAASAGKIEVVNFLQKKGAVGDPGPGLQRLNIQDCNFAIYLEYFLIFI